MIKKALLSVIPASLYLKHVRRKWSKYNGMETGELFATIYSEDLWGKSASDFSPFCSGAGTDSQGASTYIQFLTDFLTKHDIRSVVEIGCGDFRIMQLVLHEVPSLHYIGLDVAPNLIEYNSRAFSSDNTQFICANAVTADLPSGDCLIIRQVLQHLGNDQVTSILSKTKKFKYVLITEHLPVHPEQFNKDKKQGPDIRLFYRSGVFIEEPPFGLKEATTVLEYREDVPFQAGEIEALMRTSLVTNS